MHWKNILIYTFITYCIFTWAIYFISDFLLFPRTKASYKDSLLGDSIIKLTSLEGEKITAVYLPNPKAHFTLLISQGNNADLGISMPGLMKFNQQGFSVFAYDYRGYGTSEGKPSEKNTYRDIEAAYDYLTQVLNIPSNQIIIHGRSLGSGPSIDLASRKPCGGVIIESAFLSAFRVYTHVALFPVDKYNNYQKIKKIQAPILIIHGTKDKVIPFWHAEKLLQLANPPKTLFSIEGGAHNFHANMTEQARNSYFSAISKFTKSLVE